MKKMKKILAVVLSLVMASASVVSAFAEDSPAQEGTPYSGLAHVVDGFFGVLHDGIFGAVQLLTRAKGIPTYEEYVSTEHDYFYKGTNGTVEGSGWSGGFAKGSIIPESWRCDADGTPNPNGSCLNKNYGTGGYQTKVSKLYTDQMMNMVILSNGSDSNQNGKKDIIIFANIDGVGATAGTCLEIRKNAEEALKEYGIEADDILSFNISATHCHGALDTQGMNIPTLFNNKLNPFTDYDRSLNEDMEKSICSRAFACAKEAYAKMEAGSFAFFETDGLSGANDKLNCGAKTKNYFSCFIFEGESGEKTILSNIGAHPTSYGAWDNNRMMCADYPYFMALALQDAGYNLVFTQSSQASVSGPSVDVKAGDEKDTAASAWVAEKSLTKEEWVEKYGADYADKWYDDLEDSMRGHMKKGYLLAHAIIDASAGAEEIEPTLNIRNTQTVMPLDNGVMALGSISGLLGENVVKYEDAESGYADMVEINYLEIGSNIAILTAPGELSPTMMYGTDPDYTGTALWNGTTSWTGETWQYDTIVNTVRSLTGDSDKTVLLFGITNDELGYMYPDICVPESLLGTLIFYKENPGDMTNCMLMTVGTECGSTLMEAFKKVVAG